jgi:hypothetical protein
MPISLDPYIPMGFPVAGKVRPRRLREMIRYRFEFVGPGALPLPDYVDRSELVVAGTVEVYGAARYVVESVNEDAEPAVAVLRRVLSG